MCGSTLQYPVSSFTDDREFILFSFGFLFFLWLVIVASGIELENLIDLVFEFHCQDLHVFSMET